MKTNQGKRTRKTKISILTVEGMTGEEMNRLSAILTEFGKETNQAFIITDKKIDSVDKADLARVIGQFIKGAIGDKLTDLAIEEHIKRKIKNED
jgi:hypothetical protein